MTEDNRTQIVSTSNGYMIRLDGDWYVGSGDDWCRSRLSEGGGVSHQPVTDAVLIRKLYFVARREAAKKFDADVRRVLVLEVGK